MIARPPLERPTCSVTRLIGLLLPAWIVATALPGLAAEAPGGYESPPVLSAAGILPPELLAGDHFRVREEVRNDGYMNIYLIDSDFGAFEAYGLTVLKIRVHEIHALERLGEISKSEVFVDAVKRSATSQAESVKSFADKPVETVRGTPDGIRRGFRSLKRNTKEGYEVAKDVSGDVADTVAGDVDGEQGEVGSEDDGAIREEQAGQATDTATDAAGSYAKKYFGVSAAERRWAQKLEVDPYSSNEVLRKAIKDVSRVDAATSFGMKFAPIPRIPGVHYLGKVTHLVWTMDPREMRELNIKRLVELGLDQEQIEIAFNNQFFSPSHQAFITAFLEELDSATGKEMVIEGMQQADNREHATFFVTSLRLVSWYHDTQRPIKEILASYPAPLTHAADGRLAGFGAFEYLSWTEGIANFANQRIALADERGGSTRELWVQGEISARFQSEAEQRGWRIFSEIEIAPPADEADSGEG